MIAEHARVDYLPRRRADLAFLVFDQVERSNDRPEKCLAAVKAYELGRMLETMFEPLRRKWVSAPHHGLPSS